MNLIQKEDLTIYEISQGDEIFNDLETLFIALQGVAISCELFTLGHSPTKPGDYLTICARHLPKEVRVPLYGPIQAALIEHRADLVQIVVSNSTPTPTSAHTTSGLQRFVDAIFIPFLVSYHERNINSIKSHYSADRTKWPAAWQMSWAVRNAASHNGRVFEKSTQKAVNWEGLVFSPSDDEAGSILSLVNGGDILLLIFQMELELKSISSA